jgi:hypothetical protein
MDEYSRIQVSRPRPNHQRPRAAVSLYFARGYSPSFSAPCHQSPPFLSSLSGYTLCLKSKVLLLSYVKPQSRNRTDDTGMNDNPGDATTRRCIFWGTQHHRDGKYMGRKIPEPAVSGHIGRGHIDIACRRIGGMSGVGSSAHHSPCCDKLFVKFDLRDTFWRWDWLSTIFMGLCRKIFLNLANFLGLFENNSSAMRKIYRFGIFEAFYLSKTRSICMSRKRCLVLYILYYKLAYNI